LYRPSFAVDGNFQLEHLMMRRPDDDVALRDGSGHVVTSTPYKLHLETAQEIPQVNNIDSNPTNSDYNKHCSDPGVVTIGLSIAPMQTGTTWIAPAWVVVAVHVMGPSFPIVWWISRKGKGDISYGFKECKMLKLISVRQVNIDYSIFHALMYIEDTTTALVIYDICCQWSIHFKERVSTYRFLSLWKDLKIIPAVGKFHLGAHIKECFHKFSLNFIVGSGELDGEIMETLWAVLDKVAGMTRSMSKFHRQEVLDDYMNNGNWKKHVRSGESKFPVHSVPA
jgi:hypothetical protein